MKLKVENFGKIRSASVELNGYSIFVGDNNSGKTYLMQLIYGITDALKSIRNFESTLFKDFPFKVDLSNLNQFQQDVNNWLNKNKETIISNTFHNEINIGSISLEISPNDLINNLIEFKTYSASELEGVKKKIEYLSNVKKTNDSYYCLEDEKLVCVVSNSDGRTVFWRDFYVGMLFIELLYSHGAKSIYLPVSRSGLNLVYRDLMAAMVNPREYNLGLPLGQVSESKKLGLTQPVFDYILFLQTYKPDENQLKTNKEVLDFINKYIIKGRISHIGDEIRYITENGVELPLFLASSMVNELTPIVHLLSSVDPVGRILYDEIETSQHPTTQIQLARLMNRLVNSGINLIVSTHSDTMAAAISNLVTLSFCKNNLQKAHELKYEKEDLLKSDNIHAYQFENENGKTIVQELEKFVDQGIGFDFTLFNETNKKIFNDYQVIARADDSTT